jgi:hypothetical protein
MHTEGGLVIEPGPITYRPNSYRNICDYDIFYLKQLSVKKQTNLKRTRVGANIVSKRESIE